MKYLLYTLVNFRSQPYVAMFKQFLRALIAFSDLSKFDLAIITDEPTLQSIKKLPELFSFSSTSYVIVQENASLETALFRKFDITKHPNYMDYEKILYLDCDIIVQDDIIKLFQAVKVKSNKLFVAQEGDLAEYYWRINAMKNSNIQKMKSEGLQSFNSGTFLFKPTQTMRDHFENAKRFGLTYMKTHTFFYDQPIFNYYFNKNRIAHISSFLTKKLQMFPDTTKYYPEKTLMHISGIGRYKQKALIMKTYLAFIKKHKNKS